MRKAHRIKLEETNIVKTLFEPLDLSLNPDPFVNFSIRFRFIRLKKNIPVWFGSLLLETKQSLTKLLSFPLFIDRWEEQSQICSICGDGSRRSECCTSDLSSVPSVCSSFICISVIFYVVLKTVLSPFLIWNWIEFVPVLPRVCTRTKLCSILFMMHQCLREGHLQPQIQGWAF